jgi:hypothetical protein
MNDAEFIQVCQRMFANASSALSPTISARLKSDKKSRKDKKPNVRMFSIVDKKRAEFWDRYYGCYALLFETFDGAAGNWITRFIFHKKRKETGGGKFNIDIRRIMLGLDGQNEFRFKEQNDEVLNLTKDHRGTMADNLEKDLTRDLAFLIEHLHPKILRLLGT